MVSELSDWVICSRGFRTSGGVVDAQDSDAESSGTGSKCGSFFSEQVQRPPWQQLQDAPSYKKKKV